MQKSHSRDMCLGTGALWYTDKTALTRAEVYKYTLSTLNIPDKLTGPHQQEQNRERDLDECESIKYIPIHSKICQTNENKYI